MIWISIHFKDSSNVCLVTLYFIWSLFYFISGERGLVKRKNEKKEKWSILSFLEVDSELFQFTVVWILLWSYLTRSTPYYVYWEYRSQNTKSSWPSHERKLFERLSSATSQLKARDLTNQTRKRRHRWNSKYKVVLDEAAALVWGLARYAEQTPWWLFSKSALPIYEMSSLQLHSTRRLNCWLQLWLRKCW